MEARVVTQFTFRAIQEPARTATDDHALDAALKLQDTMLGTVEGLLSRVQVYLEWSPERGGFDWRTQSLIADVERTVGGMTMLRSRLLAQVSERRCLSGA
jgi:hypothetical protein